MLQILPQLGVAFPVVHIVLKIAEVVAVRFLAVWTLIAFQPDRTTTSSVCIVMDADSVLPFFASMDIRHAALVIESGSLHVAVKRMLAVMLCANAYR